jgi:hypothetical protein
MLDDLEGDGMIIFGKKEANKKTYLEVHDDYVNLVSKLFLSVLPLGLQKPITFHTFIKQVKLWYIHMQLCIWEQERENSQMVILSTLSLTSRKRPTIIYEDFSDKNGQLFILH